MIGIIGAMDEEVAILKESMEVQDTMERAGMTFVKGIMSGKEVVVVRSGIGKVNMGICAQILIDCVPLPAPGAPNMMIFIKIFSFYTKLVDSTNGDTEFSISNVQLII